MTGSRRPPRGHGWSRPVERLLLIVGLIALGYYGWVSAEARLYQAYENRALDTLLAAAPRPARGVTPAPARRTPPRAGAAIGRIEIPRLGVSAIIRTGSDARTLQLAVGHVPGTALPGEIGNVGLAGHRDTFFRRLEDIAPADVIRLVTPEGQFAYRVERTDIVQPTDVWVLDDAAPRATLTLITCYPFTFVGSAPERFVVSATLQQPAPAPR